MNTIQLDNQTITPSKVVCIGRNYVDHIHELNNEIPDHLVVFLKPNSAIASQLYSEIDEPIHFESEICFLYQDGKFSAVGFGLDLTKRQLQSKLKAKSLPWERAKAFDNSAIFSDFVAFDGDTDSLSLKLFIDGQLQQEGGVELMMYKPDDILKQVQEFMSLTDGDIVMTGTPKGVDQLKSGASYLGQIIQNTKILTQTTWQAK